MPSGRCSRTSSIAHQKCLRTASDILLYAAAKSTRARGYVFSNTAEAAIEDAHFILDHGARGDADEDDEMDSQAAAPAEPKKRRLDDSLQKRTDSPRQAGKRGK